jgi:HEAT repeat protein
MTQHMVLKALGTQSCRRVSTGLLAGIVSACALITVPSASAQNSEGGPREATPSDGAATPRSRNVQSWSDPSRGEPPRVYSAAAQSELREQALALLVQIASQGPDEARANALEALSGTPARLGGVIEPALAAKSAGVRGVAAMVVGRARLAPVAELCRPLLNDSSVMVRAGAVYALRRSGMDVDPTLLADMLFDPSPRVRAHAAFILGELGDKSAVPMIRESLRERGPGAARAAQGELRAMELQMAEARVKLGDDTALSEIRTALFPARAEDLEATVLACQIVGQIRDQQYANQLINLTKQKDDAGSPMPPEVRLAAAGGLAKLGKQPRNAAVVGREYAQHENDAVRAQAAFVLGESRDTESLPTLERLLSDPVNRVKVSAAAAIVKITTDR